jgi:hypothetical protein
MSKNRTITPTHIVTTTSLPLNPTCPVPSIRSLIRGMLLDGATTQEITAKVIQFHPTSAAAAKPAKHIAWYKATMKKAGELKNIGTEQLDA